MTTSNTALYVKDPNATITTPIRATIDANDILLSTNESVETAINSINTNVQNHNTSATAHDLSNPNSVIRQTIKTVATQAGTQAAIDEISKIEIGSLNPVFGICRIKTGGGSGLWFHTDGDGNPINLTPEYFNRHPIYAGIKRVLVDGQIMNEVPAFWVKHIIQDSGPLQGCPITIISPTEIEGFHIYPAFMNNGVQLSKYLLGCYKASMDGTTKLASVGGVYPAVSKTFATFKTLCENRNVDGVTGFMLEDIYQVDAIRLLMLAEFANPNMQNVLGMGHVNGSSAVPVDSSYNHTPWRNFHGLYGNVWEYVDGARADANKKLEIFNIDGSRNYVSTNIALLPYGSGDPLWWIVEMHDTVDTNFNLKDVFIAKTVSTVEANGTYSDAFYNAVANSGLLVGQYWSHNNAAGIFCKEFTVVPTFVNSGVGTRIAKI